jgi:hypothetical protein
VQHTGQTGHIQKAPNHQTGQPTSKLTETRNSPNTRQQQTHPDIHPSKNPPRDAPVRPVKSTGQTGVAWAARDEQHPRVNSPESKPRSLESLHGLEQDFGVIGTPHEESIAKFNPSKTCPKRTNQRNPAKNTENPKIEPLYSLIWEGNHSPKNHEGFPQISPVKSPRARSRKHPKKNTKRGLRKSTPRTTGNNTTRP